MNCSDCKYLEPLESCDELAPVQWYCRKYHKATSPLYVGCSYESEIKDSGERTTFDTGAVRDMHEGKGRFDLMPWLALIEVSKHCEAGAKKYGEHNIDRGVPFHSLADSGARHLAKYIAGMKDENHLVAACWNLLWLLEETITKPELNDMYWNQDKKDGS